MKFVYLLLGIVLIGISVCFIDSMGSYRWSIKTLTDPAGDSLATINASPSDINSLLNEKRVYPDFEKDQAIRYSDEKRKVRVDAILLKIKIGSDGDFHLVLQSPEGKLMVAEVPDGEGFAFDKHPELRKRFDALRTQIIKTIGFAPEEEMRDVNKPVTVEGIPFWDKIKAGHSPKYGSADKHEIHPVTKIVFN